MRKKAKSGRGLFYHRDSGGRHEQTPGQYVEWAARRAQEIGVAFDGTPERLEEMICSGRSVDGDLFLDFVVAGNKLSRSGLDALFQTAKSDNDVTHIFIPRRDRLARPDDPIDGMQLENRLRQFAAIVFINGIGAALERGQRQPIGDIIASLIDYNTAGEFRRDLSEKMILRKFP